MDMEKQGEKQMLSKKEVANMLNVSISTVDRMMKRGDIPFHKFGVNVRFDRRDIEQYIEDTKKQ